VIFPAANRLAKLALRANPRVTVESVRLKLMTAGLSRRISPNTFLAAKAGFAIGLGTLGLLVGSSVSFVATLMFALSWGFGGFTLPGVFVSMKARGRREKIRAELPDALDLLAVSVEAGLGFDGALDKLTDHMDGPLAEEFSLTLGEMRIGESRHDALKKLAERVDTPEVASFARAIIQADQLGISLGRILKVQSADSRNRRQMAAEEKAMKAPIKMLFPTVAFIFPAMFLVVLGPAVLSLKEIL
jgi:tight adherence protein C